MNWTMMMIMMMMMMRVILMVILMVWHVTIRWIRWVWWIPWTVIFLWWVVNVTSISTQSRDLSLDVSSRWGMDDEWDVILGRRCTGDAQCCDERTSSRECEIRLPAFREKAAVGALFTGDENDTSLQNYLDACTGSQIVECVELSCSVQLF